jgi:hypothetical protein
MGILYNTRYASGWDWLMAAEWENIKKVLEKCFALVLFTCCAIIIA